MTEPGQVVGRGEARGPGADDEDALAGRRRVDGNVQPC